MRCNFRKCNLRDKSLEFTISELKLFHQLKKFTNIPVAQDGPVHPELQVHTLGEVQPPLTQDEQIAIIEYEISAKPQIE